MTSQEAPRSTIPRAEGFVVQFGSFGKDEDISPVSHQDQRSTRLERPRVLTPQPVKELPNAAESGDVSLLVTRTSSIGTREETKPLPPSYALMPRPEAVVGHGTQQIPVMVNFMPPGQGVMRLPGGVPVGAGAVGPVAVGPHVPVPSAVAQVVMAPHALPHVNGVSHGHHVNGGGQNGVATGATSPKTTQVTKHDPTAPRSGIFVGKNKGHVTTRRALKPKPSNRKGSLSKKTKFVRDLVREVVGFAPYERRVMELLRNAKDKRARKLAKRRLGTLTRAKRKVEELSNVIAEQRRTTAAH
ncbi:hypothetical protein HDU93_003465 [Gonapodya sp. JEL0774]|nr:hypothetical protein HDU93_003465 [Gonapodya sp. JEL0774]